MTIVFLVTPGIHASLVAPWLRCVRAQHPEARVVALAHHLTRKPLMKPLAPADVEVIEVDADPRIPRHHIARPHLVADFCRMRAFELVGGPCWVLDLDVMLCRPLPDMGGDGEFRMTAYPDVLADSVSFREFGCEKPRQCAACQYQGRDPWPESSEWLPLFLRRYPDSHCIGEMAGTMIAGAPLDSGFAWEGASFEWASIPIGMHFSQLSKFAIMKQYKADQPAEMLPWVLDCATRLQKGF